MLLAGGVAFADPAGQSASTFVPRADAPAPNTIRVDTAAPAPTPSVIKADAPKAGLAAPIKPVQAKEPAKKDIPAPVLPGLPGRPTVDPYEAYIRLEPPGRERLFGTRDSERELEERMRQERRDSQAAPGSDTITFPERPEITEKFQARKVEPVVCAVEPSYVVYRRLYFEEKNAERYGWDLGMFQPAVSTLYFFKDIALLPHNIATYPCRRFETNAGQCRPGDSVPYLCYPPEFTSSGLLAEVGAIALLFAVIPAP